ncbi:MAG: transcriptional repressor AgaR [Endozoicomonas sp.]
MKSTTERREKIIGIAREKGSVRVDALARKYQVSTVTIRNDLSFLEQQGLVMRSYGGAILRQSESKDVPFRKKNTLNHETKQKIGARAAALIEPGDNIILDSGSTTHQIACHMQDLSNVTVMTSALNIAGELVKNPSVQVLMTGGILDTQSLSMSGIAAEQTLGQFHFDKLFLAVDGFHLENGITTWRESEARLNKVMCDVARDVIVVTDSSKFDKISLHRIIPTFRVDRLITDSRIPDMYYEQLKASDIDITLVDA